MKFTRITALVSICLSLAACGKDGGDGPEPYASTYSPLPSAATIIRGATVLDGLGQRLDNADVVMRDGKIAAIGTGLDSTGLTEVDGGGKWVTPGVIDVHSHQRCLGVRRRR